MKKHKNFDEAVYQAGLSRFRPIVLTSFTTVAGLAPLIFETSFQAQFLVPMAISVAYGMLIATYITLVVLPVFLVMLNRIKTYGLYFWRGTKPAYEVVEPAYRELKSEQEVLTQDAHWDDVLNQIDSREESSSTTPKS